MTYDIDFTPDAKADLAKLLKSEPKPCQLPKRIKFGDSKT